MINYDPIITKLEMEISNLRSSENIDMELRQILRLIYILKHSVDRQRKSPIDRGGFVQMCLSL